MGPDFFFSLDDLFELTLGSYQLKQSLSYIAEHLNETGEYYIETCIEETHTNIIRARIQSRHISSKKYLIFIQYDEGLNGLEAIIGYYCVCKAGSRTVGC